MREIVNLLTDLPLPLYRLKLAEYREMSSTKVFDNDTFDNAKVLMSQLVAMANETIKIHTTAFCDTFFEDAEVKEAFHQAAQRNVKLFIVSREKLLGKEIKAYREIFQENFFLQEAIPLSYSIEGEKYCLNNFTVIDDIGVRYEQSLYEISDTLNCHKEKRKNMPADGCFNFPEWAKDLTSYIDPLFPV